MFANGCVQKTKEVYPYKRKEDKKEAGAIVANRLVPSGFGALPRESGVDSTIWRRETVQKVQ